MKSRHRSGALPPRSFRRSPPIAVSEVPGTFTSLAFQPDPVAVQHLRRTWHPPLPIAQTDYLFSSQVVTLTVAAELSRRYAGWEALALGDSVDALVHEAVRAMTALLKDGPPHAAEPPGPTDLRTRYTLVLQGLTDGRQTLGQEIASLHQAFREWAEPLGTTPTLLWRTWAPGFQHPAVHTPPLPMMIERWRGRLLQLWETQQALGGLIRYPKE